jgi:hypothetical protein
MKIEQHIQLDRWIAVNINKWPEPEWVYDDGIDYKHGTPGNSVLCRYAPTENRSEALHVLEKCAERMSKLHDDDRYIAIGYERLTGNFIVCESDVANGISVDGDTLPLAICLFARRLFEKGAE